MMASLFKNIVLQRVSMRTSQSTFKLAQVRSFSMAAAPVPAENLVSDFYSKIQADGNIQMTDLTAMIREGLMGESLSPEQFEELQPVIDEVVSIVPKVDSGSISVTDT